MCQPLYGTHANWDRPARPSARKEHEPGVHGDSSDSPTPPCSQIIHRICPHLHVHRSIVLNGPERAPKSPRNGPSSTHGSGDALMDQKQKLEHIPQTTNHASAAHKRAIQCKNLRIRRAPFVSQQIIPTSNRQKHAATQARNSSRTASSCDEKLPCDHSSLWAFIFRLHKIEQRCSPTASHVNESFAKSPSRPASRRPSVESSAYPRIEKLIPNPRGIYPQPQQSQPLGATHA